MASRYDFAVGTDDVGPVDAVVIEESSALHLYASDPPEDPAVAAGILIGLEPARALALCELSDVYKKICDDEGFKERYRKRWHIRVRLLGFVGRGFREGFSLFGTRNVGDFKELHEKAYDLERTDYTLFYHDSFFIGDSFIVPTAQSSLGGMIMFVKQSPYNVTLRFDFQIRAPGMPLDRNMTHWFANGKRVELSE